ncbi:MOSC domain-containing protein, partial [Tolypothrix campylonemoides VB511288]
RAYLRAITVRAFRGIGPERTLKIDEGRGLTIVSGRNGSGKSSFAEAAELLFTNACSRFSTPVASEGWRNRHETHAPLISADLVVEGVGPISFSRKWGQDAALGDGETVVKTPSKTTPLKETGWLSASVEYRPFLAYSQLGDMFDAKSQLHDALVRGLGVEEYEAVRTLIKKAAADREKDLDAANSCAGAIARSGSAPRACAPPRLRHAARVPREPAMHLSALFLHPMKSCAPLAVESAQVLPRGLAHDRRWLAVDPEGRFVTGRQLARMTRIHVRPLDDGGIELAASGRAPLRVPVPAAGARVRDTVWKDAVDALPAGDAADAWLGDALGRPLRLVHMDDGAVRAVDPARSRPGDEVSFADAFPLLLLSQAALDALNAKLARPVTIARFRPNLVIAGTAPHAEDGWRRIRVGDVEFDVAGACTRCVFTTVDPDRGERDADGEPLRTLTAYRRTPDGVTFGQNLLPRGAGTVRVGDPVVVLA